VLLVLAGRLDTVMKEIRERLAPTVNSPLRDADASPAAETLIPSLLTAGVDATSRERFADSVIAELLKGADAQIDRGRFRSPFTYRFDEDDHAAELARDAGGDLELGDALAQALGRVVIPTSKRRRYLEAGTELTADAVARIVENKSRWRYPQAAAFAVAQAEAIAISKGQAAGDAAADNAQSRYPRHVAYRSELMSARKRSPFLTSPDRAR
jgi:hypothetical protein